MQIALLVARLLLGLVFGVAGISKAADADGSRRAIIGFGVPEKLASILGGLLPIVEIVIALALIPLQFAWLGAIAAFVVLSVFASAIAINLARGRAPDCHCFGQLHSEPVGRSTLTRNLLLMAAAGFVIVQGKGNPGASALGWLEGLKTSEIVNLVLGTVGVGLLVTGVSYLRRMVSQQSILLARIDAMKKVIDEDYAEPAVERGDVAPPHEGLPVGAPAPGFALASVGGDQITLDDLLLEGKSLLLLFVSPNCFPCETLLPAVADWEQSYSKQLTIALLSKGSLEDNRKRLTKYGATNLLLQGESNVADDYEAKWTPAAVIVRKDGKIASNIAYGDQEIRTLVARTVTAPDHLKKSLPVAGNGHGPQITILTPNALKKLGEPVPKFSLPDTAGKMVRSSDLIGTDTLFLFWDPKCPYCREMASDFEKWEQDPPEKAPRLVFVSSGDGEIVRTESKRFKSLFLHDQEFEVGLMFGTNRTPSAVLIDADGRIASAPTGGRVNILSLAGVRKAFASVEASI